MVPFPINGIILRYKLTEKLDFKTLFAGPEFVSEGPYHNSK